MEEVYLGAQLQRDGFLMTREVWPGSVAGEES